jgi:cell division protein FtsI (penicillin-binding protein 3)
VINCAPGRLTIGSATISDAHPHGALSVAQVIQKSSNVGVTKMALTIPPQEMWQMFDSIGFGQVPQLGFPGEVTGRLRPWKKWRPIEQATMSYGHGISVSLIQLARAYSVFARDGDLPRNIGSRTVRFFRREEADLTRPGAPIALTEGVAPTVSRDVTYQSVEV